MRNARRVTVAALAAVALVAAGCGGDDSGSSDTTAAGTATTTAGEGTATTAAGTATTTASGSDASVPDGTGDSIDDGLIPCTQQYKGKTVTLFSSIRDIEAERLEAAYKPFETCTGADLQHEGSGEFEAQLKVRIDGGQAPDIAIIPQPGLLQSLVGDGKITPINDAIATYIGANFNETWNGFVTVDGTQYAAPLGANIKSLVWYSPQAFADAGYEVPDTWQGLLDLSQKIVDDGGTPWCVGSESGGATGWVITDWIEDLMLRVNGVDTYDQWVNHTIPFNDPKVKAATEAAGEILTNNDFIAGGTKSISVTPFAESGLGILDGSCFMHRQANFYANNWPEGTTLGPDGQVNTFYFPTVNADDTKVMLGGGEFMAPTSDKPEVMDAILYMTSADYANSRSSAGGWMSANEAYDPTTSPDALGASFVELLRNSPEFRFDASDSMPAAVGQGTFWKDATAWINGDESLDDMLNNIEKSWPAS
jgi:alpha-glucoside transport system substrate-binding protein